MTAHSRLLDGPPYAAGAETMAEHLRRVGPLPAGRDRHTLIPVLEDERPARSWWGGLSRWAASGVDGGRSARRGRGPRERRRGRAASAKDRVLMASRPHLVLDGAELAAGGGRGGTDRPLHRRASTRPPSTRWPRVSERRGEIRRPSGWWPRRRLHRRRGIGSRALRQPRRRAADRRSSAPLRAWRRWTTHAGPERREPGHRRRSSPVTARSGTAPRAAGRQGHGADHRLGRAIGRASARSSSGPPWATSRPRWAPARRRGRAARRLLRDVDPRRRAAGTCRSTHTGWPTGGSPSDAASSAPPARGLRGRGDRRDPRLLARESAGQCGPCMFGLRAIADATRRSRRGRRRTTWTADRWAAILGRGRCRHPDGAAGLMASALQVFGPGFRRPRHGARLLLRAIRRQAR